MFLMHERVKPRDISCGVGAGKRHPNPIVESRCREIAVIDEQDQRKVIDRGVRIEVPQERRERSLQFAVCDSESRVIFRCGYCQDAG